MTVKERFLKYVTIDTQSNEETGTHPSTAKQFTLAKLLADELKSLGAQDVRVTDTCYVYASLPATAENAPSVGFIAHLDTEPVCSGKDVEPVCVQYTGGDILLKDGKRISAEEFPFLNQYIGEEIVCANGKTLLGADDKAGIAEIMTAVEYLLSHPEIKRGRIGVAFTPDEEIGEGADGFDVEGFGCDYAYTVDGEEVGELGYETFNAAQASITFQGKNIHPGVAKGKMVNCNLLLGEFLAALPESEIPAKTEGREGFYHVCDCKAEVESGTVKLIIRDHSMEKFLERKAFVENVCARLAKKYGEQAAQWKIKDQYLNCYEKIKEHFHLIENAREAYARANVTPLETPVRGGTDGATLSFMGLPCPNLFTGGRNAHSLSELVPVCDMEKAVEVLVGIAAIYGKTSNNGDSCAN